MDDSRTSHGAFFSLLLGKGNGPLACELFFVKTITIVGGGLAGLFLGILLRRRGLPVIILEAGDYPRHKVCGEFISGAGISLLSRMGMGSALRSKGLLCAETAQFFKEGSRSPKVFLPEPSWCISRWSLDATMAETFRGLGGVIKTGIRDRQKELGEGWVNAGGRRRVPAKKAPWVGVKFHLASMPLMADLEMHFQGGAYVGICQVEEGRVNVCALVPRNRLPTNLSDDPISAIANLFVSSLGTRMVGRERVPGSLTTVGGLDYLSSGDDGCQTGVCLGDTRGLIPPITGNGMSLALESAALAATPLEAWARGHHEWDGVSREIRLRMQSRFSRRLFYARWLQRILLSESVRSNRRFLLNRLPLLLPFAFRLTR